MLLSGLVNLIELRLADNLFTDLSPLRGLTTLQNLELTGNSITELSALSGLTNLSRLDLRYNPELSNIQALLENPGIGQGDIVELRPTSVTCAERKKMIAVQVTIAEKAAEARSLQPNHSAVRSHCIHLLRIRARKGHSYLTLTTTLLPPLSVN